MASAKEEKIGASVYGQMDKINSELLTMTYGAIVTQLIKEFKDIQVVNKELETMGYNIGVRLIDELLAKSGITACNNFVETANVISKVGMKMFLGVNADAGGWSQDNKTFSLTFKGNPLNDFVELPAHCADLEYSNIICGAIRGALSMVQMVVECRLLRSELKGASETEIQITLKEVLQEEYHDEEED